MRAVTFSRFGGPEVMEARDVPEPAAGPGEVRIRVVAATVNPTDIGFRAGRQAALLQQLKLEPPYIPGMEFAGVVDQAGEGVSFHPGQRVMAIVNPRRARGGAQAELVVVPEKSVALVPDSTSLEAAATLPMNGLTVRRALDMLDLKPGQTLAVTGAAGAVGGYAVQLGANAGLRVIAVAGPQDEQLVRRLGAETFVPRGEDAMERIRQAVPGGVDGLIDAAVIGAPVLRAIRDGGGLATVRDFAGESERGITIHQVHVMDYVENQPALQDLARMVADGKLDLRVAERFPPERAGEAQQKLEAGGTRGRLVIVFGERS